MKLSERELWLVDKCGDELYEEIVETILTDIGKPWRVILRIGLIRFALKLKRKGKR